MFKYLIPIFVCVLMGAKFAEGTSCYHCYESFYKSNITLTLNGPMSSDSGDVFVECSKSKPQWNVYDCPSQWPSCVVMGARVVDHYEIVRTCASSDFCARYKPPAGVELEYCSECTSPLCNDYPKEDPDFPVAPGPLITFNVNVTLKLLKSPIH